MSTADQLFHLPHVATRLFEQPLAIERSKLHVIASVLAPRLGVVLHGLSTEALPQARTAPRSPETDRPYAVVNAKAVIPVFGTLVQRAGSMEALSGLTSYESLRTALTASTNDPTVTESVLHIDSGGGEATGLVDFLDFIQTMDTRKPVTAVTDGMAASAAYGIMSAASRRLITQDATVGSIGVRLLHVDQVKYNDVQGVTVTEFFAGARKVDFSPHEALTEEKRAALQALVDAFYGIFTGAVARHLGVTQQFVRDTEAGLFVGRHAIDRSLAHAISTLDAVLASPAPARTSASGASQTRRSIIMSDIATVADLEATYPALVAQIRADASESAATATAAAQQAERSRIREILDLAPLGCEALAATCCFTTPVSASDAAKQFLAHQKTLGPERLAQLRADAPAPVRPSVESDDQEGKEAQTALRAAAARRNHAQQQRQLSVVTGRRA